MSDLIERLRKEATAIRRAEAQHPNFDGSDFADMLDEAAAELSRLREAHAWRPISEHNGSLGRVLVGFAGLDESRFGYWLRGASKWQAENGAIFYPQPTHFMELLAPPSDAGTEADARKE